MRGGYQTAELAAQRNRCRVAQMALYHSPFRDFVVRHSFSDSSLVCLSVRLSLWISGSTQTFVFTVSEAMQYNSTHGTIVLASGGCKGGQSGHAPLHNPAMAYTLWSIDSQEN